MSAASLILRRQDSRFIQEWDRDKFWSVFSDGVPIGVIVLTQHRSDEPPRWDWVFHLHAGRFGNGLRFHALLDGQAATKEEAMAAFRASWDIIRPVIGDEGWALHLEAHGLAG